ncbi:MAG: tetrathionate reductase family octaheme c-type cytochrome [Syntrophobacteraceae bacterium]|jgi:octaheme c-type cytochrome (tetrathionate reductase family)|nr:tetrathionate reductase family octaheme c-type cytochrome [Syntrophobacteraceae bacterium]
MRKRIELILLVSFWGLGALWSASVGWAGSPPQPPPKGAEFGVRHSPNFTADHSKFKELQQEFKSGPEVTKACLSCHTEAAMQFHKTIHWTWMAPDAKPEDRIGKAGLVVNNFCISLASNEPRCTSCHAGYGWKDKTFDFTSQEKVDCLVCHEQTGTYKKFPAGAGHPADEPNKKMGDKVFNPPDWNLVAQSVALPTRRNCGECHFFGGGGEGVKHGDLDASMFKPDKALDVHMDANGLNFTCQRCHTTEQHAISGRSYKLTEQTDRRSLLDDDQIKRITCYSCHSEKPHKEGVKANDHTDKIACQTCHIPAFARKNSTKMYWDWSTAGKRDETGKPVVEVRDGRPTYDGMKGSFVWEKNVVPEYSWYNGKMTYLTLESRVDPGGVVRISQVTGSASDPNSRIFPFKVHRGKQPYDRKNNHFVAPHLFGKDDTAYWKGYDWVKAIQAGQDYAGLPFSGEVGFLETEYLFQTTHMVAPREQALSCTECHSSDGRMKYISGIYMPGRDSSRTVDTLGWAAVLLTGLGVVGHGSVRYLRRKSSQ